MGCDMMKQSDWELGVSGTNEKLKWSISCYFINELCFYFIVETISIDTADSHQGNCYDLASVPVLNFLLAHCSCLDIWFLITFSI